MSRRRASALWSHVVVAAAGTLSLAGAPAAHASDGDPWLASLAERLRDDPVLVSDSVARAVSPQEAAGVRAAVRAMPVPTRVAILSGTPDGEVVEGPSLFELPELLAGALDRPGLYVVTSADNVLGSISLTAAGVRPRVEPLDVQRAVGQDVGSDARPATRVRYALRVAATGERPLRGVAERALDEELADDSSPTRTEDTVAIGFLCAGGLAGFAVPTARWWRRRPRRDRAPGEPTEPEDRLRKPDPDVAEHAADAVTRLAAAIAAAPQPSQRAFELYSAAAKADREARAPIDHLGALLLASDGENALRGRPQRRRCFFDPDHRRATTDTRWRLGRQEAEVPACRDCARALKEGRRPDALADRGTPYYERDTVWARTGFGAIDDELAAKVLSGR